MPIDVNRSLARDNAGHMLWDHHDVVIETDHGPYIERQLIGQPNGGCVHRTGPGGMQVFMYCDDPGVFYNERGGRVSEGIARQAGFDVDTLSKAQRKKQAMLQAQKTVEEEYAGIAAMKIIEERGEYRLVEPAPGHFQIQFVEADGSGSTLTTSPLTEKAARKLFVEMAGEDADDHVRDAAKPR